jgi:phenylalanyl-tRNA synthetase beta chain
MGIRGDGAELVVTPETYRVDLTREIDLVEEVARLHGFHRVPVTLPSGRVSPEKKTRIETGSGRAKDLMTSFGFWEVINYSFLSPQAIRDLGVPASDRKSRALPIQNPLGEDQSVMRTSLIPGLLQTARTNTRRQNLNFKFFELGRVFFPREGESLPEEVETLAGLLSGLRDEESWAKPKAECDFFDLKGVLEALLDGLGVSRVTFPPDPGISFLHPGKSCRVEAGGESLGMMGELHSSLNDLFDLKQRVFVFELDFQKLSEKIAERRSFTPLPRYPAVTRDLALVVDGATPAGDLLKSLWEANEGLIQEIRIFDLYQGTPVPPGKKSLAFRLVYQREDRTLTDQEVNAFHEKLVWLLARKYGGTLR